MSTSMARRVVALLSALLVATTLAVVTPGSPASAAAPEGTVELVAPVGGEIVNANPTLMWEPLDGVDRYTVQVSSQASFASLLWSKVVVNVSATPDVELPNGQLHWRVAPMNPSGSEVGTYTVGTFSRELGAAPVPVAPADGDVLEYPDEPVALTWEPVQGVKTYRVEVDDSDDFIGATAKTTDATTLTLTEPQAVGATYYWRVQGLGASGAANTQTSVSSSYSLSWGPQGTPDRPTLLSPDDGESVQDVALRWSPVAGAAKYHLQVSPDGTFDAPLIDLQVMGTSYSPPTTLNNASYYWRVRAVDTKYPNPNIGPWSGVNLFHRVAMAAPVPVAPVADGVASTLLLQWDPVPHASAYEVQIGTDAAFTPTTYGTCVTTHTDFSPFTYDTLAPTPAQRPGTYCTLLDAGHLRTYTPMGQRLYWRVRGLDQPTAINGTNTTSIYGQWSVAQGFTYRPGDVGAPSPTSPGGAVEVPLMRWEEVPGAVEYVVVLSRVRNGVEGPVGTFKTEGTSYIPSLSYDPLVTEYRWTVHSVDGSGRTSNVADGAPFVLSETEPGGGATPALSAPAHGATVRHPHFDWTPVAGATRYEVRLWTAHDTYVTLKDHNRSASSHDANPFRSEWVPTRLLDPGTYEWSIVAWSGVTNLGESPRRTMTISRLGVATATAPENCAQGVPCTAERATPLLQWDRVPGATYYRVHVALDPVFTNMVRVYRTEQNALRPSEALVDNQAGQSYYWIVQPCGPTGCAVVDSTVHPQASAFRKESRPVELLSPAHETSVADLTTFDWSAPSEAWVAADGNDDVEARTYRIEVSTTPGFENIIDSREVDQTTYTPYDLTYPEGPLYWRVRARDGSGNYLTLSAPSKVEKRSAPLTVVRPAHDATIAGVPVFQWEAQTFAASYQLEVYKDGDTGWTAANRVLNQTTKLPAFAPEKTLPLGTYAWRVRRLDADGKTGPWLPAPSLTSPGHTFTLASEKPGLLAPADGTVFTRPRVRLEWSPVAGAATYHVQTSMTPGFGSIVEESKTTPMTAWSLQKLHPSGTVYWRVIAKDAQGLALGTSATGSFVHDLARPTALVTITSPGAAAAYLEWSATAAPNVGPITKFRIRAYVGESWTIEKEVEVTGSARSATVTGLVNDRQYRFSITPYDANGIGTESPRGVKVTVRKVAPFSTVDNFVKRQYLDFFDRSPSATELSNWRSRLGGSWTAEQAIQDIWRQAEHESVMPPITRLYAAFLGRTPDYGGTMYWAEQRRAGKTLNATASFFASSSEFLRKYGDLTNRAYVLMIYEDVMGRTGDPGGITFWTSQLDAKRITRGALMVQFSESPEYKRKTFGRISATIIYMDMLRRRPTDAELASMTAIIVAAGQPDPDQPMDEAAGLRAAARAMLASPAYLDRVT